MKSFMMNTLSVTFFYVAVYAFITESPVIYIRHFGIDPQYYGLFFGVNIIGVAAVSYFNRMFVTRFSLSQLLKAATGIAALFSLAARGWTDGYARSGVRRRSANADFSCVGRGVYRA